MNITLISTNHGFHDFDIAGFGDLRRATVSPAIKKGETFNLFFGESSKVGATWIGKDGLNTADLERSIKNAAQGHEWAAH